VSSNRELLDLVIERAQAARKRDQTRRIGTDNDWERRRAVVRRVVGSTSSSVRITVTHRPDAVDSGEQLARAEVDRG
jgi:hypothetical protein